MEKARKERRGVTALLVCALGAGMLLAVPCAYALDPALDVSQYAHTAWKIREGFSKGRVTSIAQTPDVRTELAADLPQVMGDRVELQQVLMNLMMNSIDAMKGADGTRELTIQSQSGEDGLVLISVSDTGVGLPPEQADKIFNAFFTTKSHGTGMGLRISRSIVEAHGGRLWAAENSPRGARFCFTVPTGKARASVVSGDRTGTANTKLQ